ncbi:MAG: S8 family serine peptidase, partial [Spirochaetaceae bacterium]
PDPSPPGGSPHGTHVAGTVAARTDNDDSVAGIGWSSLAAMPVRVLDGTSGDPDEVTAAITEAIFYAAGSHESDVEPPSRDARVINMSLGGGGTDAALYDAIAYAVEEGMTVVAAAGNNANAVLYPAAYDHVIAVSATDVTESRAYYSNLGQEIDFAAPGGDIRADTERNQENYPYGVLSIAADGGEEGCELEKDSFGNDVLLCQPAEDYEIWQGTSMAAPHVSGVVGLLYSYAPNLKQNAVYAVLANSAKDLGESGHDEEYGHGLIDAEAALEYLINAGRDYPVQPRTSGGSGSTGAGSSSGSLSTSSGDSGAGGGGISNAAVDALARDGAGRSRGARPQQRSGAILPGAGDEFQSDSIIIKLTKKPQERKDAEAEAVAAAIAHEIGATGVKHLGERLYRIDLADGAGPEAAIRAVGKHEDVEYAQPNYRYRLIN